MCVRMCVCVSEFACVSVASVDEPKQYEYVVRDTWKPKGELTSFEECKIRKERNAKDEPHRKREKTLSTKCYCFSFTSLFQKNGKLDNYVQLKGKRTKRNEMKRRKRMCAWRIYCIIVNKVFQIFVFLLLLLLCCLLCLCKSIKINKAKRRDVIVRRKMLYAMVYGKRKTLLVDDIAIY